MNKIIAFLICLDLILISSVSIALNPTIQFFIESKVNPSQNIALHKNILDYYAGTAQLNQSLMLKDEIRHIKDVKKVLDTSKIAIVLLSISIPSLINLKSKKKFSEEMTKILKLAGMMIIICSIIISIFFSFFDTAFYYFHLIFFPNGNFSFSANSALIRAFPEEFFFWIGITCLVSFLMLGFLLISLSFWIKTILQQKVLHNSQLKHS